jgi:multiple sugar transport system substrate-binding protein
VNIDAAKEFLLHYTANFQSATYNSKLYDLPARPSLVPQLAAWLANDPFGAQPANKLMFLSDAANWSASVGHPGSANAAIGEVFAASVIPNMFGRAARGEVTPRQVVLEAERQILPIFEKWRARGLVGG